MPCLRFKTLSECIMIVKKHVTPDKRLLLSVCDSDILGKQYSEGEHQLDLTSNFYNGDEMSEEDALVEMKKAYMLHIIGQKSITLAKDNGYVSEEQINTIENIPFAHALMIAEQ